MGRVLVTGASGYLGGRLCIALVHAGHSVVALVRKTSVVDSLPPEVELADGDIQNADSVREASAGCDYVIHTAALVGSWLPDSSQFVKVNVSGLKNVVEAVKAHPSVDVNVSGLKNVVEAVKAHPSVKKLIFTSSFFALGPTDGYVADETQFHSKKKYCSPYEESKVLADEVAQEAMQQGVPIIALYPGMIYGPGKLTKGNSLAEIMIERFNGRMPGYLGNGNDRFSLCHIDDVVVGHLTAIEVGKIGERYLLCGENISLSHIFNLAASLTNTAPPKFQLPYWLLEFAGHLCELWSSFGAWSGISHQTPFITSHSVEISKHQWAYSSDKAERELSYKSRPFEEGLLELLTWLRATGNIKF